MKQFSIMSSTNNQQDMSWEDFVEFHANVKSFLEALKPMRGSGRTTYRWEGAGLILVIERDSDAVAFRLRFGI